MKKVIALALIAAMVMGTTTVASAGVLEGFYESQLAKGAAEREAGQARYDAYQAQLADFYASQLAKTGSVADFQAAQLEKGAAAKAAGIEKAAAGKAAIEAFWAKQAADTTVADFQAKQAADTTIADFQAKQLEEAKARWAARFEALSRGIAMNFD